MVWGGGASGFEGASEGPCLASYNEKLMQFINRNLTAQ
ncbi:MAG: hypothetical protein ACJATF_002117 [Flavobacteriales bacterium]|jgi:hypothetical protein